MNLREAAQQALEALEVWRDSLTNPRAMPGWRFAVVGEKAIANLRAALAEDRVADTGKTHDDTDDTLEQRMLRKKWFGGRLYGHLPFLAAVDETMKNLHDQLDELKGTWNMLDNHFPGVSKMVATSQESRQVEPVATIRPEVTVEPVAFVRRDYAHRIREVLTQADFNGDKAEFLKYCMADKNWLPLYTAPPKRKPLTDEDIDLLRQGEQRLNFVTLREFRLIARAIERAHGIGGEE